MPVEITVGPPLLSINQGATLMVTNLGGEIQADTEQGVFADDTRFVSYYAISANGVPWRRLNSAATAYFAARVYLTNAVGVIRQLSGANVGWGVPRIMGELRKLGIQVAKSTVEKYRVKHPKSPSPT